MAFVCGFVCNRQVNEAKSSNLDLLQCSRGVFGEFDEHGITGDFDSWFNSKSSSYTFPVSPFQLIGVPNAQVVLQGYCIIAAFRLKLTLCSPYIL